MKGIIRYFFIITLSVAALKAEAQSSKAALENQVLSAVRAYGDGHYDKAIGALEAVVEKDQTNDAAYYYLGRSYIKKKEMDAAEVYLQKAVALDSSNFWYRQSLAMLYAATSRGELAIDVYEKLLRDFPKKSDIYLELVELYAAQKEIDKALATIEEVEKILQEKL